MQRKIRELEQRTTKRTIIEVPDCSGMYYDYFIERFYSEFNFSASQDFSDPDENLNYLSENENKQTKSQIPLSDSSDELEEWIYALSKIHSKLINLNIRKKNSHPTSSFDTDRLSSMIRELPSRKSIYEIIEEPEVEKLLKT
jgi:hypothetical protein